MRAFFITTPLLGLVGAAHAHPADAALLQHALEHGWLALVLLPLLLLLPIGRSRG